MTPPQGTTAAPANPSRGAPDAGASDAANYRLGLILVSASAIAWSTAGLFTRLIALDAWTMLAWRGIFGAMAMLAVILVVERKTAWRAFTDLGWPGWSFAIISAVGMICYISALRETTVAHVAIIYATAPFIAAGLGWLVMRERPGKSAMVASLVALVGIVVMVGIGAEGNLFGDMLALGMTLALAAMMVLMRRFRGIPVMLAAALSALLSGLVCWPLGDPLSVTANELGLLALFGMVNSAVGLSLFVYGSRLLPAIETALIGALDAPLAPILVWLAFAETPSVATLTGGAIVFAAVFVHVVRSARRSKRPATASVQILP